MDDLALLCGPTHDHFEQAGFATRMINGRPWLVPPPWIDPQQTPIRNTYFD